MTKPSSRPVNDLHIVPSLQVGGAETALARYLSHSARAPQAAVIALTGDGPMRERFEAAGVPVHILGMTRGHLNLALVPRFIGLVRRLNPAVVSGWLAHGMLAATLAQIVAPGRCGLVWNVRQALHDLTGESRQLRLILRGLARLSSRADAIIYNSQTSRRQHEAIGFAAQASRWIPNGVAPVDPASAPQDREQVRAEFGIPQDAPLIGHIARLHKQKDHATLLRGFAHVLRDSAQSRLLIVGGDDAADGNGAFAQELKALAGQLGLTERAIFTGPRKDISRLTHAFDLAVNTSYTEAFPNAVVEAMAAGCPVIATDVGDCRQIIADAGTIVPPGDPEALARAIINMLALPAAHRQNIGQIGRQRVDKDYTLERMVTSFDAALAGCGKTLPFEAAA